MDNSLYTKIILDNARTSPNRKAVEHATHVLEGVNPSCGDDITLQLRVENGTIADAGFVGSGCAISQASASIMVDLIKGQKIEDAERLSGLFLRMIKGEIDEDSEELDDLEDGIALSGIRHTPARVKCAVLSWHTLDEMLQGKTGTTTGD